MAEKNFAWLGYLPALSRLDADYLIAPGLRAREPAHGVPTNDHIAKGLRFQPLAARGRPALGRRVVEVHRRLRACRRHMADDPGPPGGAAGRPSDAVAVAGSSTHVPHPRLTAVRRRSRRTARFWAAFAPGTLWLVALFLVPAYAILAVAFGGVDPILRTADPVWNPLAWDFGGDAAHVSSGSSTATSATSSCAPACSCWLALIGCFAIGYPVAYYVARKASRSQGLLLVLLVLPFWISYLMRMLAWVNLLQTDGYVNQVLGWLQLGRSTATGSTATGRLW